MYYTNGSLITKTFHGVTFGPGETKEVFGIINDPKFILASTREEPPVRDEAESSDAVSTELPKQKRRGRKPQTENIQVSSDTLETEGALEGSEESAAEDSTNNHIEEV